MLLVESQQMKYLLRQNNLAFFDNHVWRKTRKHRLYFSSFSNDKLPKILLRVDSDCAEPAKSFLYELEHFNVFRVLAEIHLDAKTVRKPFTVVALKRRNNRTVSVEKARYVLI